MHPRSFPLSIIHRSLVYSLPLCHDTALPVCSVCIRSTFTRHHNGRHKIIPFTKMGNLPGFSNIVIPVHVLPRQFQHILTRDPEEIWETRNPTSAPVCDAYYLRLDSSGPNSCLCPPVVAGDKHASPIREWRHVGLWRNFCQNCCHRVVWVEDAWFTSHKPRHTLTKDPIQWPFMSASRSDVAFTQLYIE